jgi:hypothetical protein
MFKMASSISTRVSDMFTTAVPEPGTWLLMLGGLAGLVWRAGRLQQA